MRNYFAGKSREARDALKDNSNEFVYRDRLFLAIPSYATGIFMLVASSYTDEPKKVLVAGGLLTFGGLIGILSCSEKKEPLEEKV